MAKQSPAAQPDELGVGNQVAFSEPFGFLGKPEKPL